MKTLITVIALVLTTGCASRLTPEQRAARDADAREPVKAYNAAA